MKTALIVIDVQASFTRRPYFQQQQTAAYLAAYLAEQNRLIAGCSAAGVPIVRVFHVSPGDDVSDPFSRASGCVKPLEGLTEFDASLTVYKERHSALVGTGLDVWLVQHGIQQLIVSGIRTEQCCETTTRHASDLGWKVLFVPGATLTFDMALDGGGTFTVPDIRTRTAAVLQGRFADVVPVDQALQRASADATHLAGHA